jgi:hypothetical protein
VHKAIYALNKKKKKMKKERKKNKIVAWTA